MKKIFKELALVSLVLVAMLHLASPISLALAQVNPLEDFREVIDKTDLPSFDSEYHDLSSVEPGASIITSVIFRALDFLKYALGTVAVLFVIVSGMKLVMAGKKIDEVSEKEKESLKLIIFGFILVIVADELVSRVFFGEYGECIASQENAQSCAQAGSTVITGVYSLILAVLASVAVFMITLSAFRIITAYGNEEQINQQKSHLFMAVLGLLLAGVGEFVVKQIIFPEGGSKPLDVDEARKLVFNFTSFISAFISVGAFVMMLYGGYLYVISGGEEEQTAKGKKIVTSALIGIVIALAAYGLVATVTRIGESSTEINLPQNIPGVSP